ncbi:septum formation family protein [Streptomyces sp. NPDC005648]|uniref:septum formation family protein n=1 Tax=Streptomyces sp. NPDC005648 TaxID=3157044 RepID=UPI0033AC308E
MGQALRRPDRLPSLLAAARRRKIWSPQLLLSVAAGALGAALVVTGVWLVLAQVRSGDENVPPYGSRISLAESLKDGDCVVAEWPGVRFKGTPRLTLDLTCRAKALDGQVMAMVEAATDSEARSHGAAQCEQQTQEIRAKLADVRSFAVVPTRKGFKAAGGRIACLVLGAHGPLYGPLGSYRKLGTAFTDTATMQKGDCLKTSSNRNARLVSCAGPHDEQVLGFTRLGSEVTLAEARKGSDAACSKDVPPRDYGFDQSIYTSGSWSSKGSWLSGTHFVVCTVRKQNGGTIEGSAFSTSAATLPTGPAPPSSS